MRDTKMKKKKREKRRDKLVCLHIQFVNSFIGLNLYFILAEVSFIEEYMKLPKTDMNIDCICMQ